MLRFGLAAYGRATEPQQPVQRKRPHSAIFIPPPPIWKGVSCLRKRIIPIIAGVLCVMLCIGCQKAAAVGRPEMQVGGSGTYRAEINGDTRTGTFDWDGFTVGIRPDCASCAPSWTYDGTQYVVTSGSASFAVPATVFPADSVLRTLPAAVTAAWSWTDGTSGWVGSAVADGTVVRIEMDGNGKIIHLSFPAANAEIALEYAEKNTASVPAAA